MNPSDDEHKYSRKELFSLPPLGEILRNTLAVDLRSLALFRITFALTLLIDLYWRLGDLKLFYSDEGTLTRAEAIYTNSVWTTSLYYLNGTWQFQLLMFAISAAVYLALLLGYRTQMASVLSWILLVSIQRRNPQVLQGGDNLLRCLSFWAMFVPLGAFWSIDSKREDHPAKRSGKFMSAGAIFLQLQVLQLYIFSALLKTGNAWVKDYSAIYYALSIDSLTGPIGRALLPYRDLLRTVTREVVSLELLGPLLPLIPWGNQIFRMAAVLLFIAFHLGLLITMQLGPFPYVCMTAWLIFIPEEFWNRLLGQRLDAALESPYIEKTSVTYSRLRAVALAFFFLAVVLWNIRTLDPKNGNKYYSSDYNYILELVGLDQNWGMFAPYPMTWDGWYEISGTTFSGRKVNLTPGAGINDPISEARPDRIDLMYRTERWRKYLVFLSDKENGLWRGQFVRGLLFRWADSHPNDLLKTVDMYFWLEYTLIDGSTPPEKIHIWLYQAPETGSNK